jgi:methylated-DNA-[protein]-cysteine S-methyltransferase
MATETFYTIFNTPLGWMGLLGSAAGVSRVILPQATDVKAVILALDNVIGAVPSSSFFKALIKRFQEYFTGKQVHFRDKLDFGDATDFQKDVWEATKKIPYGKTHTYAWVAAQVGKPQAVRAVGQALGRNPVPIIVPCHRVTNTGGGLGGFSGTGGLKTKQYLLRLENNRHQEPEPKQLMMDLA